MAVKRAQTTSTSTKGEELGLALAELYYRARREYEIDLTHRAIRVLQFISHHEKAPGLDEITKFLGSAPSTASELIKRLQNKGLVVRRRSSQDERTIEIELTGSGRAALTEHTSLNPRKLQNGLQALGDLEQEYLIGFIKKVTEAIR
ncbi:hypothetical protein BAL199_16243 [alpha proteobacterium BAL199]|jgi:MarR family transcriptional regulator, organic hydroperoxide resistance regulator|nr:hypothetical protein BAL199_16243 [alpha proteobacterium BAL199]